MLYYDNASVTLFPSIVLLLHLLICNVLYLSFEGNYGSLGLFDRLYGTHKTFQKTIGYQRRRLIFSTTPMDVLYPSDHGPYKVIRD